MSALLKFVRGYAMVRGVGVLVGMCGNWFQVVWGVFWRCLVFPQAPAKWPFT